MSLSVLACYGAAFALFWAPGCCAARFVCHKRPELSGFAATVAFAVSCLLGYVAFWIYRVSPVVGLFFSWIVLCCGLLTLVILGKYIAPLASDPLMVASLIAGAVYLSIHFSGGPEAWDFSKARYFERPRRGDTEIPLNFALAVIRQHQWLRIGDPTTWHFSERPPLQTGAVLLLWPLTRLVPVEVFYQCVGTMLQVGWIVGLGTLLPAIGASRNQTAITIALMAASGFVFYNCVYLWPKMLAAGLFLGGVAPVGRALVERRLLLPAETALSSAAITLALLAHSGIIYSLIALVFFGFVVLNTRTMILALVLAATTYAPWYYYQTWVDPNPGRLSKAHLAGLEHELDARGLVECVEEAYRTTPPSEVLQAKEANFRILLGHPWLDVMMRRIVSGWREGVDRPVGEHVTISYDPRYLRSDLRSLAVALRIDQREHVARALGFLNVGWLFLAMALLRRRLPRGIGFLLGWTAVTLVLWCLLEFEPSSTITIHASYAMMLCLFAPACIGLTYAPRWLAWTVAAGHVAMFASLWIATVPSVS
jgi:hypothetical protein